MPIGNISTKAGKRTAVKTEMDKWKAGTLHSGSKSGPVVKNQKQAIAIALSESGQSRRKRENPGPVIPYKKR